MEFPHLGEHCNLSECKQLDFLPFKCVGCSLVFCKDHFQFDKHSCANARDYDHQVPICPLCDTPVSFKYGEMPDVNMNRHIDQECSVKRKKSKIYKNKCMMTGCKDKELIELICEGCKMNYCLKHRHFTDHNCTKKYLNQNNRSLLGRQTGASSSAAAAAMQRFVNTGLNKTKNFTQKISNMVNTPNDTPNSTPINQPRTRPPNLATVQSNQLNEDEALAIAIEKSLNDQQATIGAASSTNRAGTHNEPILLGDNEDDDLKRAIELSKREYERNKDKCLLS